MTDYSNKSSVDQIRERFDNDVERFSKLQTGQEAAMDSRLCLDLVSAAAAVVCPHARSVLDIGCGAGNYSLVLHQQLPQAAFTLNDLSQPMLDRARERLELAGAVVKATRQADIRQLDLPADAFDVIVAAAVLHHLRDDEQWRATFKKIHATLRPGGCFWIVDLVTHADPRLNALMQQRYADYLDGVGGPDYRQKVFAYIEQEDTPRPLEWQLDLLREVGFPSPTVLHRHATFAAYGAIK